MRFIHTLLGIAIVLAIAASVSVSAQDKKAPPPDDPLSQRYALTVNLVGYPQATPQEAVKSVARALSLRRIGYLLAHLSEPRFVDRRVAEYREAFADARLEARPFLAFDRLTRETEEHFLQDPQMLRELRAIAEQGDFQVTGDNAVGSAKAVPARKVYLHKLGDRWFLDNRQQ